MTIVDFRVADLVQLRKPHPCGGSEWSIYRIGADIGFQCETCGRRVMLNRRLAEKRLKAFVRRGPEAEPPAGLDGGRPAGAAGPGAGSD